MKVAWTPAPARKALARAALERDTVEKRRMLQSGTPTNAQKAAETANPQTATGRGRRTPPGGSAIGWASSSGSGGSGLAPGEERPFFEGVVVSISLHLPVVLERLAGFCQWVIREKHDGRAEV